ncbi:diphosphomevalonate/mevalonate 3,5-bisphosphate decarboxylase family protein [Flavicella marina]|uniref:diphosphomevalonate/mevalonate 3,5-bisphosphate decarboxylase family protein n=1 Tax=Flavicella marina TaxID=1475951 RepID=UPI001263FEEB|nr:diphosphomevalonate decarboxylase [Flavicella marina]
MTTENFIASSSLALITSGSTTWKTPSNIALVKYWGKRDPQLPENPSISFTLNNCHTITTLSFEKKENLASDFEFKIVFEGEEKPSFQPKIQKFFERIVAYVPFIKAYKFVISSENSFPHSSGIASSASGMSAISMCLMQLEKMLDPSITEEYFYKKASFLARLGSGSACRSIKGELVVWGAHKDIEGSSDLFGVPFSSEVAPIFKNYQDTVLLVDKGEKQVSSTVGHDLMHGHPYAKNRFAQAVDNISKMKNVLEKGAVKEFIELVESEALTLHAMMMTSQPYFILMKPNTLEIIQKIWSYRAANNSNICFTLDAGANVHILYPKVEKEAIHRFIEEELSVYCQNAHYIHDEVGEGAQEIK